MPSNNTRTSCYLTSVTFKYLKHDYRQYSTIRSHYNYKSVLSLVPRLSTWRCPQLARRRQLSIDICRPRPSYGNQLRVAAAFDRRDRQTDRQTDGQTDGHSAAAASVNSQCAVHVQYRLRRASWWRSWCREDATTCGPCTTVWWTVFHAELARRPTAACSRANLRPYNIHVHVSHERNRFTTRKVP